MTTPSNQNISVACYLDDSNQLQISLSDNLDSEQTRSFFDYFDYEPKQLVEIFGFNVTQEVSDLISNQITKNNGGWVDQFATSKPILVLGFTYDFLDKLNEERKINGDEGLKDYAVAIGRSAYNVAIGVTVGAAAVGAATALGAGAAGIFTCNGSNLI